MTPPKLFRQVREFVGLVNYFRDMWYIRSHLIQPVTALTSTKVKFIVQMSNNRRSIKLTK